MGDHTLPTRAISRELENAGKRGPGGRIRIERTAWQRIFRYLASGGGPHLTLGLGIAQFSTRRRL